MSIKENSMSYSLAAIFKTWPVYESTLKSLLFNSNTPSPSLRAALLLSPVD